MMNIQLYPVGYSAYQRNVGMDAHDADMKSKINKYCFLLFQWQLLISEVKTVLLLKLTSLSISE